MASRFWLRVISAPRRGRWNDRFRRVPRARQLGAHDRLARRRPFFDPARAGFSVHVPSPRSERLPETASGAEGDRPRTGQALLCQRRGTSAIAECDRAVGAAAAYVARPRQSSGRRRTRLVLLAPSSRPRPPEPVPVGARVLGPPLSLVVTAPSRAERRSESGSAR